MDGVDVRSISILITLLAFIGIAWWAFSPSRKKRFEEDAKLPFAEDDYVNHGGRDTHQKSSDNDKGQKEV